MTALQELRPSRGNHKETNRWPGILFAVVLHGIGIYALMSGLSHPTVTLLHENTQAVVVADLPRYDLPPPQPPDFKPPPVITVVPDVAINLSEAQEATTSPTPAAMAHAPSDAELTPPVPITSHAVTSDDYPPLSIRLAEEGVVNIKYLVQSDGTVGQCAVITSSGSSRLDDAACTMVKKRWRFTPATQRGKPVAQYLLAQVNFKLIPSSSEN
jgi:periplasmic protein TonB